MWLTARELSNELHIPYSRINSLRKQRRITYINIGSPKHSEFRYQMPEHVPAKIEPPIERVGLLTYTEVAEILGCTKMAVSKMFQRKAKVKASVGNRKMITVAALRELLARKDRRKGQTKKSYSPLLMKWLKAYLAGNTATVQVLDSLIKEAASVTSDKRSGYITRLWDLFDQVQALLGEIEKERNGAPGET